MNMKYMLCTDLEELSLSSWRTVDECIFAYQNGYKSSLPKYKFVAEVSSLTKNGKLFIKRKFPIECAKRAFKLAEI